MHKPSMLKLLGACITIIIPFAASLPYNPSAIWVPTSQNHTVAYFLSPKTPSSNELRFQSANLTGTFDASSPSFFDFPVPPFSGKNVKAVVPIVGYDGVPTVYTGDCQSDTAEVWRYAFESNDNSNGEATWSKTPIQRSDNEDNTKWRGPNYLASAASFPNSHNSSASDIYVFAGMCPTAEASSDNWVSAANYSQSMVSLQANTSSNGTKYAPELLPIRYSPVAEAGLSMTPLLPAYSNSSTGEKLRQQSFAVVGGHTQAAFINMSRIALFSLPEASWSYVLVNGAADNTTQEGRPAIEPRSGHTAVLTPDGSKIIVFGGWVGDTSIAAQPQLAILELGRDYIGSRDWAWTIPKSSPHNLQDGMGIFGHGAAMLPGGIMMVKGGYKISQKSSKRSNQELSLSDNIYLFNTTSESWVTSYSSPLNDTDKPLGSGSGPLSKTSQKAGLGVGLGLGVPLAALVIFGFCFVRNGRFREHRKYREQTLRDLALGAERPILGAPINEPMMEKRQYFEKTQDLRHEEGGAQHEISPLVAERTGLLVETPSPTRGLRPSARSRSYHTASLHDDSRRDVRFSPIREIEEVDEFEDNQISQSEITPRQRDSKTSVLSDPFKDPPSPSKAFFPSLINRDQTSDDNVQNWMYAMGRPNTDTLLNSPTDKQDRTLSNLSGTSGTASVSSFRTNPRSLNRSPSQMSNFGSHLNTATLDQGDDYYGSHYVESNRVMADKGPRSSSQLSFAQLQAEGSSLLGANPSWMPQQDPNAPKLSSGSKNKALGWAGSVRRALGSLKNTESTTDTQTAESHSSNQRSSSTSPTKSFSSLQDDMPLDYSPPMGNAKGPRRAISTSSSVLQRKKGAKDWNAKRVSGGENSTLLRNRSQYGSSSQEFSRSVGGGQSSSKGSDSPHLTIDGYEYDDDEDWDVEAAAEGRVVQVTFTVPKERLRVVNAGDGDSIDDDDDGARDESRNNDINDKNPCDDPNGKVSKSTDRSTDISCRGLQPPPPLPPPPLQ